MTSLDKLRPAAEEGNIGKLYDVIKDDPSIFVDKDSDQFLQTPLHIAAAKGHIPFAVEVMNLKPSFAFKLNPQGWSPIHLAIQNQEKRMVLCFVNTNKELVRLKGREGMTPLHLASEIGDVELLAEFLTACPDSMKDVTVRGETALHIAAKNKKYEALHLFVCFLRKNTEVGAKMLEYKILNQKDEDDNTVLHISAVNDNPKELQLLIESVIELNSKNLANKTALDMTISEEIYNLLSNAGAKSGSQVTDPQTLAILSPPGGIYQANASDNDVNIISSNSTNSSSLESVGISVMSRDDFVL
ncbi:ankyrin repeat-containing protein, partial [Trifolium pratense]